MMLVVIIGPSKGVAPETTRQPVEVGITRALVRSMTGMALLDLHPVVDTGGGFFGWRAQPVRW